MTAPRERWSALSIVLLALITVVVIDQARFLFVYPIPDTGMWFGDETWTMLTLRELARTGVARVPEAIGSSLAHSNGLINGSVWMSGLVYGVPAEFFRQIASPVSIGRVISFLLALLSLWLIYYLSRRLHARREAAMLCIFALVLSNAFSFSSHSARLDMITGLSILLFFALLLAAFDHSMEVHNPTRFSYLVPFLAILSLTIYVHVPALIALPALYALWRIKAFRSPRAFGNIVLGAIAGAAIIVGAYWLSAGSFSLLGSGYNQYYNVANSLPILHLRSWRVQKINTFDRALQVWRVAWPLVIALAAGAITRYRSKAPLSSRERFFVVGAIWLILSWVLFGGPAVFYNIYVLPVATVCAAVLLTPLFIRREWRMMGQTIVIGVAMVLSGFTILSQKRMGAVGARLVRGNDSAIHSLIDPIASPAHPPLVLTDEPAIDEIAADSGVRLMTNHLLLFGGENRPLAEILLEHQVNYLLLYSTTRWHSPFRAIADSLFTLVSTRTGTLTDQARTYDEPDWNEIDTLRLYKAQ